MTINVFTRSTSAAFSHDSNIGDKDGQGVLATAAVVRAAGRRSPTLKTFPASNCYNAKGSTRPLRGGLKPECSVPLTYFLPCDCECIYARSCYRYLSVCLSVCLSLKRAYCDKTKEKSVHICIPYERSIILVVRREEWSYLNFGPNWPRSCKTSILNRHSPVAPQP